AHIAIGNTGSGYPATANGRVRGHIGTINGPIVLADQPQAAGTGEYYNIEVDVSFDALGENITEADPIIRVGAYLPNGLLDTSERTIKADNITFNVNKGHGIGLLDNPIKIFTPSPNYGLITLSGNVGFDISSLYPSNKGPVLLKGSRYSVTVSGGAEPKTCVIPAKHLSNLAKSAVVICNLRVQATNNTSGQHTYAEYAVIGQLSSSGTFTLIDSTKIFSRSTGGVTPAITIAASLGGSGLSVSIDSYAN